MNTKATTKKTPRKKVEYKDAADRFSQLATKRLRKAAKSIKLLGNLSGSGYEYTPQQVEYIGGELRKAVDKAMARFAERETFTVDDLKV